jgi:hypothetical protein
MALRIVKEAIFNTFSFLRNVGAPADVAEHANLVYE